MRAFDFAARAHWAIQTEIDEDGTVRAPALKNILEIALRAKEPDFEAVAQKMADRQDQDGVMEMRGSVAVINVAGPIFRYANLFTWISGATSVQELATAFRAAVDDPTVSGIVLNVDSPGGEVAGIGELATAIYEARGTKPIVAYADDLTASAAYWLASAADKIVASDTAELGSIGVVATVVDRGPREGVKTYQFVSSQSPNKRPSLETDAGRATIQQRIDDLAAVFVAAIARNRGVSEDKVLSEFGQGGVMIASKAIAAGMADSTGSFEGVIAELAAVSGGKPAGLSYMAKGATGMKSPEVKGSAAVKCQCTCAQCTGGNCKGCSNAGCNTPDCAGCPMQAATKGVTGMKTPEELAAEQKAAGEKTQAEAVNAAKTAGIAEGRKLERARYAAILSSEPAKGRQSLALSMASETEMDAEVIAKLLTRAPLETKTESNPLANAMAGVPNPKLGTTDAGGGELDEVGEVAAVVAAGKRARGGK
jgi:signal peptide peptidase SppA